MFLPRLRSQTQSGYVQTGPDGKCLCPDRPRLKVPMSRPSQTESGYVQTFVRSKFFVRSSCVRRQIFPDHPRPKQYMSRLSCVLVQTIVRSNSKSCVQCQIFSASMSRPSCGYVQTIVRLPGQGVNVNEFLSPGGRRKEIRVKCFQGFKKTRTYIGQDVKLI